MTNKNTLSKKGNKKQKKAQASAKAEAAPPAEEENYSEQLKKYLSDKTINKAKLVGLVDIDKFKITEGISSNMMSAQVFQINPSSSSNCDNSSGPEITEIMSSPVKKVNVKAPENRKQKPSEQPVVSDHVPAKKEGVENWLEQSFGDIVVKSQPKAYLFKLVEFNKIEIIENHQFLAQNSELEYLLTKFMGIQVPQRPEKEHLKMSELKVDPNLMECFAQIEEHQNKIEGSQLECHSLILSIVRLVKTQVQNIYKNCNRLGVIDKTKVVQYHRSNPGQKTFSFNPSSTDNSGSFINVDKPEQQQSSFQMFFKDASNFRRQYLQIIQQLQHFYEEIKLKAQILKPITDKIFTNQTFKKYIDSEQLFTGFFFMFVYKDFVIRELINQLIKLKQSHQLNFLFLEKLEGQYNRFISNDFVQWLNLILSTETFQSYASVVTPNEVMGSSSYRESRNYQNFLKRYIKIFLKSQDYVLSVKRKEQLMENPLRASNGSVEYSVENDSFQFKPISTISHKPKSYQESRAKALKLTPAQEIIKRELECDPKMKFTHGIGNINIKNIWDIQHIKKLTDDLFDSQMSVTSHIPNSIFFENLKAQNTKGFRDNTGQNQKNNIGVANKSSIFKNKKFHKSQKEKIFKSIPSQSKNKQFQISNMSLKDVNFQNNIFGDGDFQLLEDFDSNSSNSSGYNMNISKDGSSDDSETNVQTFDLWKNGSNQVAKIDFEAADKHQTVSDKLQAIDPMMIEEAELPSEDLKSSCLTLIDQLSFYYDSFYDKLQLSEGGDLSTQNEIELIQYKKLQKCMQQTREFLLLIQGQDLKSSTGEKGDFQPINLSAKSNLSKMDFSPEQEKTIRSLISDLKMYLNGFKQSFEENQREIKKQKLSETVDLPEECEHFEEKLEENLEIINEQQKPECSCEDYMNQGIQNDLMSQYNNISCPCCQKKFLLKNFLFNNSGYNIDQNLNQGDMSKGMGGPDASRNGGHPARRALRQKIKKNLSTQIDLDSTTIAPNSDPFLEQISIEDDTTNYQKIEMIQTKLNQYKAQMEQKQVTLEQSDLKNIEILQQKIQEQKVLAQQMDLKREEILRQKKNHQYEDVIQTEDINIQEFGDKVAKRIEEQEEEEKTSKQKLKNKKRRLQKKNKKIKEQEQELELYQQQQNNDNYHAAVAAESAPKGADKMETQSGSSSKSRSIDSEFEENLKAFGGRLDNIYKTNYPIGRLIPNVSHAWIQHYNRQSTLPSKSKSPNKSSSLNPAPQTRRDQARAAGQPHSPQGKLKSHLAQALSPSDHQNSTSSNIMQQKSNSSDNSHSSNNLVKF